MQPRNHGRPPLFEEERLRRVDTSEHRQLLPLSVVPVCQLLWQVRGELHNEQLSLYTVDERGTVAGLERKLIERISLSEGTVVSDTSSTYVPEPQLDTPVSVDDCSQIRPRMGVQDRDTSGH